MILVKPSYEILKLDNDLKHLEACGRTCYDSEMGDNPEEFIGRIIKSGHESVIEHSGMSVRFICDRGISHELVRHRLCSYSQRSTRFCDSKGGIEFVIPPWVDIEPGEYSSTRGDWFTSDRRWAEAMLFAEGKYEVLRSDGWQPQQARSILPNSLKTEIVVTANMREWRLIFKQRCAYAAHPQMRELMLPLRVELRKRVPVIFDAPEEEKET